MPDTFSGVLDWYSQDNALLVVVKLDDASYFARYSLPNHSFNHLEPSGVNYSARLDQNDNLLFYTDEFVHTDNRRISIDEFPRIQGPVIPISNGFMFQSNRNIYVFDDSEAKLAQENLPDMAEYLVDGISPHKLLFQTSAQSNADIVVIN